MSAITVQVQDLGYGAVVARTHFENAPLQHRGRNPSLMARSNQSQMQVQNIGKDQSYGTFANMSPGSPVRTTVTPSSNEEACVRPQEILILTARGNHGDASNTARWRERKSKCSQLSAGWFRRCSTQLLPPQLKHRRTWSRTFEGSNSGRATSFSWTVLIAH